MPLTAGIAGLCTLLQIFVPPWGVLAIGLGDENVKGKFLWVFVLSLIFIIAQFILVFATISSVTSDAASDIDPDSNPVLPSSDPSTSFATLWKKAMVEVIFMFILGVILFILYVIGLIMCMKYFFSVYKTKKR